MWLYTLAALSISFSCLLIIVQVIYFPYLISQAESAHGIVMSKIESFKVSGINLCIVIGICQKKTNDGLRY